MYDIKFLTTHKMISLFLLLLVVHQAPAQVKPTINLSEINEQIGLVLNGVHENDQLGRSVSFAGDINGDGFDDFIVGAYRTDRNADDQAGSSHVLFGRSGGFTSPMSVTSLNGLNGFSLNGSDSDELSGNAVSDAGDFNGDGTDDLLIGSVYATPNNRTGAGRVYLLFGSKEQFPHPFELHNINGLNGLIINGEDNGHHAGSSVSSAGDINADGKSDIVIGAANANQGRGLVYVIYGTDQLLANPLELSAIDGINGVRIRGYFQHSATGLSVSSAGDLNNDGIDDLLIGSPGQINATGTGRGGVAYVIFGHKDGLPNNLYLSQLSGTDGFMIHGQYDYGEFGRSVSAAGDFNGDGLDDIIIGSSAAEPNGYSVAGAAYVVFGRTGQFPHPMLIEELDENTGMVIHGLRNSYTGRSVKWAGDVNADGLDDVIIGAHQASGEIGPLSYRAGRSFVIYGSRNSRTEPLDLLYMSEDDGFKMIGTNTDDDSGISVSFAGDINGDGVDDVAVGAIGSDVEGILDAGRGYVIFGSDVIFTHAFE